MGPSKGPNYAQVVSADSPPSFPFALLGSDGAVGGSNSSQRLYNPSRVKSFGSVGRPVPSRLPAPAAEREKLLLSALAHTLGH